MSRSKAGKKKITKKPTKKKKATRRPQSKQRLIELTKFGITGPEPIYVNPEMISWIENSQNISAQGVAPTPESGAAVHFTGASALFPLLVMESPEIVRLRMEQTA